MQTVLVCVLFHLLRVQSLTIPHSDTFFVLQQEDLVADDISVDRPVEDSLGLNTDDLIYLIEENHEENEE